MFTIGLYYHLFSEDNMNSDESAAIADYDPNHPHIVYANHLKKHMPMLAIFKIQDDDMTILCYGAAISLALSGQATFQYSDIERILGHIEKETRTKIIHYLRKYKWLVDNTTSWELSDAARKFINFAAGPLSANDLSLSQEINIARKQADMADDYNLDKEQAIMHFKISFSSLYHVAEKLRQILQKKSRREVMEVVNTEGKKIIDAINEVRKLLRKKHSQMYDFRTQDEYFTVVSDIQGLAPQILLIASEDIQANSKSIGKYISMTMVEEFLTNASLEELVDLLNNNFSSPRASQQLNEYALKIAALEFLSKSRDYSEPTPPPDIVDYKEEEMLVSKRKNPLEALYQELCVKMSDQTELPIEEVLFGMDDTFGYCVHRTGQFIKLYDDLIKEAIEAVRRKVFFRPRITSDFKELEHGAIETMSDSYIRKEVQNE